MTQEEHILKVLLMKDQDMYVVQCLDYDIVAQGRTKSEAQSRFIRSFIATLEGYASRGIDFRKVVPKAPQRYWDAYPGAVETKSNEYNEPRIRPEERVLVGVL